MWVNDAETLWTDRNRDTWQLPLISSDGAYCGNVVAQVVEPKQCIVRYLVVFSNQAAKQFLIPSESISAINTSVQCDHSNICLQKLPAYQSHISRTLETEVHQILGQEPYWLNA